MRQPATHSYLYTVRLWPEDLGDGAWEWRGVVKLVATGEEHSFREWEGLKDVMITMTSNQFEPSAGQAVQRPKTSP